jgi:hypothetical protein
MMRASGDLSRIGVSVHETPAVSRTDQLDIFDKIADFMVTSAYVEALTCRACSLPAIDDGYCRGHARLFEYTDHERSGEIAANE